MCLHGHFCEDKMASATGEVLINEALTGNKNTDAFALETNSDKFIGTIDASAVNAATTVTALIEHSHDRTHWFTLTSFTAIVGAASSEAKQITDAVLPYVRANITLAGTTKAATVKVMLWFDKRSK